MNYSKISEEKTLSGCIYGGCGTWTTLPSQFDDSKTIRCHRYVRKISQALEAVSEQRLEFQDPHQIMNEFCRSICLQLATENDHILTSDNPKASPTASSFVLHVVDPSKNEINELKSLLGFESWPTG